MPRRSWPRRHPILTAILVLFGLGFLANNWWILFVIGAIWLGVRAYRSREARQDLARQEQQRLIASADAQNQAYLNGHQFGTQGHFPTQGFPAQGFSAQGFPTQPNPNQPYPFQ